MNKLRKWIKVVLGFSRRETNGFLILLPLTAIALFLRPITEMFDGKRVMDFQSEKATLDSLAAYWEKNSEQQDASATAADIRLFSFDPNNASVEELVSLGFSSAIATRIIRYREKGGRFKVKNDLLKVYGIDSGHFRHLVTYISLPETTRQQVSTRQITSAEKINNPAGLRNVISKINLNNADSAEFTTVRGIGPVLAQRIIRYRNILGGFHHSDQLGEVYGLDSSTIISLKNVSYLDATVPLKKLNLNRINERELASHPYISKPVAKAIVAYRFQHGAFSAAEDIRNIHALDEQTIAKLLPYLSVTE